MIRINNSKLNKRSRIVDSYNTNKFYLHSGIGCATPQQKHSGEDLNKFQIKEDAKYGEDHPLEGLESHGIH